MNTSQKKSRPTVTYSLEDALSEAFGRVSDLQEEMQSWYDNMPESLQGGSEGEQVQEAADALGDINEIELPETLADKSTTFEMRLGKKRMSRADRRDEAAQLLSLVIAHFESEEYAENDDATSFVDELQNALDELEAVEFPGMYG